MIDRRLIEWDISARWRGKRWEELPASAPGEVEQYLADPTNLAFATESIHELVSRFVSSVEQHATTSGETVFVAHQDPVAATTLALTGTALMQLRSSPPEHGSVTTLVDTGSGWSLESAWEPQPR